MNRIERSAENAETHEMDEREGDSLPGSRPKVQSLLGVQLHYLNGCAPDGRRADNHRALTHEVFAPRVATRIEQLGQFPRLRIVARDITSFVKIAVAARRRQIIQVVASAMFAGKNVLDVECGQRRLVLVTPAILATKTGTTANVASRCGIHAV